MYAAKYSNDTAAAFAPALQARLALVARKLGDTVGEQAALAKADEQLAALRQAAPNWPMVAWWGRPWPWCAAIRRQRLRRLTGR